jgi:hypothetical protein
MTTELESTLTAAMERLLLLATQDADLRTQLRKLSQVFLQLTDDQAAKPEEPSAPVPSAVVDSAAIAAADVQVAVSNPWERNAAEGAIKEKLPELTLGRSLPREPARPIYPAPQSAREDFGIIEARCRLKAEGARWAGARRRLMSEGTSFYMEIDPKDRDIIARAKALPNCFLWMCHSSGPSPANLALYEILAGCFETVAQGIVLVRQIQEEPDLDAGEFETALDLLAEAQSALRVAISTMDGPVDSDQAEVFHWLKTTANESQIFIQRYMRLDDAAEPAQWPAILARIEEAEARVQQARRRRNERKRLFGKVRHKTALVLNDPAGAADHWQILINTVSELVDSGVPASSRELRELIIPVIEHLPEQTEVPPQFTLVLREIDRFMATCPPPEAMPVAQPSKEVIQAAKLLHGRSLVLIGGDKRPGSYQALKAALGLRDLIWIETRAHESIEGFEPYVARTDVAAVVLAIRWSSHSYGDVKDFCDKHGKPLVRLPGGYNVNQVAAQIMSQCSERLMASQ